MPSPPDNIVVFDDKRGMLSLLGLLEPLPSMRAARLLLSVNKQKKILVCTGFPVAGYPETDGPAGAIALAQALKILGCDLIVVSWSDALDSMRSSLGNIPIKAISRGSSTAKIDGVAVTIEVCGRVKDNSYRNMSGNDIAPDAPWFEDAIGTHALVSIGDGGNEFGMGSAPACWFEDWGIERPISTCDALVVGQVSNWATLAVIAALSVETKQNLLPTPDGYQQLLDNLAKRGVVDGVIRVPQPTEDGYEIGTGGIVLKKLHKWVIEKISL